MSSYYEVSFVLTGTISEIHRRVLKMLGEAGCQGLSYQLRASDEAGVPRLDDEELACVLDALNRCHLPDRVQYQMREPAAGALRKIKALREQRLKERRERTEFLSSLTDAELALIRDAREQTKRRSP